LVRVGLAFGTPLPLVVEPRLAGVNLREWLGSQREYFDDLLLRHGAILFRGFKCDSAPGLQALMAAAGGQVFDYVYRSTPRKRIDGAVFSSTEYPANQNIPLHNELSYARRWPSRLWFCCLCPATRGGATPLADSRKVWQRIPESTRTLFRDCGVEYIRNYGEGLDLSIQEVFQTSEPAAVEAFCQAADIRYEWKGPKQLRTSQVCQSETRHPVTGETVWFNQAHLFHVSSLPPEVQKALLEMLPEDELPRNARFGGGQPIPGDMLSSIRAAYAAESIRFEWRAGDVLLVDNLLVAHGRTAFEGERRVVVAMTQ